jgi:hypothetical protein
MSDYFEEQKQYAMMHGLRECERTKENGSLTPFKYGCDLCTEAMLVVKHGDQFDMTPRCTSNSDAFKTYCPHAECPYAADIEKYGRYKDYDRNARRNFKKRILPRI